MTYFRVQWNDNNGGTFIRTFNSYEERAAFIPRIARRDWCGHLNYTTWENVTSPTVIDDKNEI